MSFPASPGPACSRVGYFRIDHVNSERTGTLGLRTARRLPAGCFKALLFISIAFSLLGVASKAHSSVSIVNDSRPNVLIRAVVSANGAGSTTSGNHSSMRGGTSRSASLSIRMPGIAAIAEGRAAPRLVTGRGRRDLATTTQDHTATSGITTAPATLTPASPAPLIYYTDITSGPNSGGEHNNGIYLTIFGTHFGATRATSAVTINGRAVAQYLLWSDTKIGVQVGHVSSGPIVVTRDGLVSNSENAFSVRPGHIYYIGPSGDSSTPENCSSLILSNSYAHPWGLTKFASKTESDYNYSKMRTPYTYYHCMSPGDTLVFLDGVSFPYYDGRGWHASLTPDNPGETSTSFMTFMSRPGATVQLGGEGWANVGIRNTGSSTYSVYSGLTLVGSGPNGGGLNADSYDRFVGNTVICPDCSGPAGALTGGNYNVALGNVIRNVSTDVSKLHDGSNKTYHAVYFQGDNFEFGWNRIERTAAYNGFQVNEDGSSGFHHLSIHDNDIADVNGSGINLSTVDPASGYVKIFNNAIHHVGLNSASDGGGYDPHSCIAVKGYGRATAPGIIEIYNNTMYDCSSYLNLNPSSNASCAILILANQLNVTTNLVNNIVYQPIYGGTAKQNVFICGGGSTGTLSGSRNLWYSQRTPRMTAPANRYGVIADPRLVSRTNYHLQLGSPAIGAGIPFDDLRRDFDGAKRPGHPSIGAYEYSKDSSPFSPSSETAATIGNTRARFVTHKSILFSAIAILSVIIVSIACLLPRRRSWSQTVPPMSTMGTHCIGNRIRSCRKAEKEG